MGDDTVKDTWFENTFKKLLPGPGRVVHEHGEASQEAAAVSLLGWRWRSWLVRLQDCRMATSWMIMGRKHVESWMVLDRLHLLSFYHDTNGKKSTCTEKGFSPFTVLVCVLWAWAKAVHQPVSTLMEQSHPYHDQEPIRGKGREVGPTIHLKGTWSSDLPSFL